MKDDKSKKMTTTEILRWINFNVLPLFLFMFFLAVLFFFTIPYIKQIYKNISEITRIDNEIKQKDSIILRLQQVQKEYAENSSLYLKMDTLVPSQSSQVVAYKDYLTQVARDVGLEITKSKAGEIIVDQDDEDLFADTTQKPLTIIEIPTEISARGRIEQFQEFLTKLYEADDFFVVNEMDISDTGSENTWEADFVIVKYQFDGEVILSSEDLMTLSQQEAPTLVIDFLNRKFSGSDLENTTE